VKKNIRFIPIKHGDQIDFGDLGIFDVSGRSKYLGFKPGRNRKREGWLVIAEADQDHTIKKKQAN
jgi:hypothetical protein